MDFGFQGRLTLPKVANWSIVNKSTSRELVSDLFGQALLDFVQDNHPEDIVVHSDIAEDEVYLLDHFFRNYSGFPEIEKHAIRQCKGKILDVGAGSGIHSLVLQEAGFDAYPIDVSAGAVATMRKLGVQHARKADFFSLGKERYDTLLMLMNGFGIMGTYDRVPLFFEHAKNLLYPNGQILCDSTDLIYLHREDDGSIRHDLSKSYYGEVTYQMEYKGQLGESFSWLFMDYDTASEMASAQGFQPELLYEGDENHYLARFTLPE